jgi:hypothetical protein
MPSIAGASEFYIVDSGRSPAILVPDSNGVPTVVEPQPLIFRAVYIGPDLLDALLPNASGQLLSPHCHLFRPLQSPDGPPYRTGMIFLSQGIVERGSWRDGSESYHGSQMRKYAAATSHAGHDWVQDVRRERPGYFLTGQSAESSLWRLFRLEPDALGHQIFTLAPVQFSPRCPRADFSSVTDAALRAELIAQYDEFCQRVAANAYRDALTKARNIVEGLIAFRLASQGQPTGRDLWVALTKVKELLERTRGSGGWSDIEYHLAHKIRLLHAQTHTGRVVETGRPIRPEFALTVAEDLAELLRTWGYAVAP